MIDLFIVKILLASAFVLFGGNALYCFFSERKRKRHFFMLSKELGKDVSLFGNNAPEAIWSDSGELILILSSAISGVSLLFLLITIFFLSRV